MFAHVSHLPEDMAKRGQASLWPLDAKHASFRLNSVPRIFVLVFAKLPESGKVNTRMVPPLSPDEAARLHMSSLRAVCELASSFPSCDVVLVGTPDNRVDVIGSLVTSRVTDHWSQGQGDLGQRLSRATNRAFETVSVIYCDILCIFL